MTTDRIKEELQWLRTLFPVVAAVVAALVTYVAQGTASRALLVLSSAAIGAGAVLIAGILTRINLLLQRL
jgi:hypothetical protein